jgi:hypothetical protein
MLGKISAAVRGGIIGAGLVAAFAAAAVPSAYFLGKAHNAADQVEANYDAVIDRVGEQTARLGAVADRSEMVLERANSRRLEINQSFIEQVVAAGDAADQARRAFNETRTCPAHPDDVRVYNHAFGLTEPGPGTGNSGSGEGG